MSIKISLYKLRELRYLVCLHNWHDTAWSYGSLQLFLECQKISPQESLNGYSPEKTAALLIAK